MILDVLNGHLQGWQRSHVSQSQNALHHMAPSSDSRPVIGVSSKTLHPQYVLNETPSQQDKR